MASLPPNPPHIRTLTNEDAAYVDARFPNSKYPIAKCRTCGGEKTFRWYGQRPEIETYDCPCADQYVLSRWLWHCGIKDRYQRLTWGDFFSIPDAVAVQVGEYLEGMDYYLSTGYGLIFSGPMGNGKTLLANLMLKEAVSKGYSCMATTFNEMIDLFAQGWRDDSIAVRFSQRVTNAEVLYVDDLGRERQKGVETIGENMLESIIRHRVASSLPTFISTNRDQSERDSLYGGHTASLLAECAKVIDFGMTTDVRKTGQLEERALFEREHRLRRPVML